MPEQLHLLLLRTYALLPPLLRRWTMRALAPKFTVGAICRIEREDGAVLLVRTSYREKWCVPGGLLKRREDPAVGAMREVLEETGLRIDIHGEPVVVLDPHPQRVDMVYRAAPSVGADASAVRPCSPEIEEVRWFDPSQLPAMEFETIDALAALRRAQQSNPSIP